MIISACVFVFVALLLICLSMSLSLLFSPLFFPEQQTALKALRRKLGRFQSQADIDNEIARVDRLKQMQSMSLKDEKDITNQLKSLKALKDDAKEYEVKVTPCFLLLLCDCVLWLLLPLAVAVLCFVSISEHHLSALLACFSCILCSPFVFSSFVLSLAESSV